MAPDTPHDDPFQSGSFYGTPPKPPATSSDDEDVGDYELEGPDEQMLEAAHRRAEAEVEAARSSVDIDALYREAEAETDWSEMWQGFRFQFQTKHLLLLTAVVAVITTAITEAGPLATIVLGVLFCLAGAHAFLAWREHQRQQRLEVRRQQIYQRAHLTRAGTPAAELPPLEPVEEVPEPVVEPEPFRFSPSRNELIGTIAVATAIFCLIYFVGPNSASLLLGLVALGGLVVHAVGFQPPGTVVLGWWLILVMYVIVSLLSAFRGAAG
ncbi:MAG: hypothetical protein WD851_11730 [Pirellulales bacterium]